MLLTSSDGLESSSLYHIKLLLLRMSSRMVVPVKTACRLGLDVTGYCKVSKHGEPNPELVSKEGAVRVRDTITQSRQNVVPQLYIEG